MGEVAFDGKTSTIVAQNQFQVITEAEGSWDKTVVQRLKDHVFTAGNTVDPVAGYRAFRGRDAGIDALMRKRGLVKP